MREEAMCCFAQGPYRFREGVERDGSAAQG